MEHKFSFWHQGALLLGVLITSYFLALLIAPDHLAQWVRLNAFTLSVNALSLFAGALLPVVVLILYWCTAGFWKGLRTLALCWAGSFALCFLYLVVVMLWVGLVVQHRPFFGTDWFSVTDLLLSTCVILAYPLSGGVAMTGFALSRAQNSHGKGILPESIAAVF